MKKLSSEQRNAARRQKKRQISHPGREDASAENNFCRQHKKRVLKRGPKNNTQIPNGGNEKPNTRHPREHMKQNHEKQEKIARAVQERLKPGRSRPSDMEFLLAPCPRAGVGRSGSPVPLHTPPLHTPPRHNTTGHNPRHRCTPPHHRKKYTQF